MRKDNPLLAYGTSIKHSVTPLPDRVKPSFVIFYIWALWRSAQAERQSAQMSKSQMTA